MFVSLYIFFPWETSYWCSSGKRLWDFASAPDVKSGGLIRLRNILKVGWFNRFPKLSAYNPYRKVPNIHSFNAIYTLYIYSVIKILLSFTLPLLTFISFCFFTSSSISFPAWLNRPKCSSHWDKHLICKTMLYEKGAKIKQVCLLLLGI